MPLTFKRMDWGPFDEPEPEPVYCWFIGRAVPCESVEVWRVKPDGRHARVLDGEGKPMWLAVDATSHEVHLLPVPPGKYVFIARDRRGRIRGRAEAEMHPRGGRLKSIEKGAAEVDAHQAALSKRDAEIERLKAELKAARVAAAEVERDRVAAESKAARVEREARLAMSRVEHEMARRERAHQRRSDATARRLERAEARARAPVPVVKASKPTLVDGLMRNPLLLVPAVVKLASTFGRSSGAGKAGAEDAEPG